MKHDDRLLREAKERKLYLLSFKLEGRHVPELLLTKKVAGGPSVEWAGVLTRRQYQRLNRLLRAIMLEGHSDAAHDEYVARLEKRRAGQKKK